MYRQQKKDPLEASAFFEDGGVSRHPPRGTVAAVPVRDWADRRARIESDGDGGQPVPREERASLPPMAQLRFGQERFNIWCAPCHGMAGYGDGMIVRRGYPAPSSYHIERLRDAPDSYYQEVIRTGLGKMPSYADHVSEREQTTIIAYIRALQLSQRAPVEALSAEQRRHLEEAAGEMRP
ncbi:MAG: c-type cytochrome [Phycisphaeraceae bacterium]